MIYLLNQNKDQKIKVSKKKKKLQIISKIKLYMEFLPGYDKLQYSKNYDEEMEKVFKK